MFTLQTYQPVLHIIMELARIDDEHNLIARYASKLAAVKSSPTRKKPSHENENVYGSMDSFNSSVTDYKVHQELIDELEASNKQIMDEISQLKQAKDTNSSNTNLLIELEMLKQHRDELENRMSKLHDGRQDLMEQLERLMGMLKTRDRYNFRARGGSTSPRTSLSDCSSPTRTSVSNGATSPHLTSSYQPSLSSHSSPSTTASRTRRQFPELFDAADAINDALAILVRQTPKQHSPLPPIPSPRKSTH